MRIRPGSRKRIRLASQEYVGVNPVVENAMRELEAVKKSIKDNRQELVKAFESASKLAENLSAVLGEKKKCKKKKKKMVSEQDEGKSILDWDIEDIGMEHPDYFQGRGVAMTDWDDVVVGVGDSARDAAEDALDQLSQIGNRIPDDLENEVKSLNSEDVVGRELERLAREEISMDSMIDPDRVSDADIGMWMEQHAGDKPVYHVAIYVRSSDEMTPHPEDMEMEGWARGMFDDIPDLPESVEPVDHFTFDSADRSLMEMVAGENAPVLTEEKKVQIVESDINDVRENLKQIVEAIESEEIDPEEAHSILVKTVEYLDKAMERFITETGEPDQEYDHQMYDAIASALEDAGYKATHREFDKYQGVYIDVEKDGKKDRIWTVDGDAHGMVVMWIEGHPKKEQIAVNGYPNYPDKAEPGEEEEEATFEYDVTALVDALESNKGMKLVKSESKGEWVIKKDGVDQARASSESEAHMMLRDMQDDSLVHALKFGGWSVERDAGEMAKAVGEAKEKWAVKDWAGNEMDFGEFDSFDDAEAFLSEKLGDDYETDRQEYEIVQVESTQLDEADPSLAPPKKWWNKMEKKVKSKNKDYSADQVKKTIGNIWYNDLDDAKREEIRKREGKKYGPAESIGESVVSDPEVSDLVSGAMVVYDVSEPESGIEDEFDIYTVVELDDEKNRVLVMDAEGKEQWMPVDKALGADFLVKESVEEAYENQAVPRHKYAATLHIDGELSQEDIQKLQSEVGDDVSVVRGDEGMQVNLMVNDKEMIEKVKGLLGKKVKEVPLDYAAAEEPKKDVHVAEDVMAQLERVKGLFEEDESMEPSEKRYYRVVDLDERGSYRAHVEDQDGKIVFSYSNEEEIVDDEGEPTGETEEGELWLTRDGFMKHVDDIAGLEEYLKDTGFIEKDADLLDQTQMESKELDEADILRAQFGKGGYEPDVVEYSHKSPSQVVIDLQDEAKEAGVELIAAMSEMDKSMMGVHVDWPDADDIREAIKRAEEEGQRYVIVHDAVEEHEYQIIKNKDGKTYSIVDNEAEGPMKEVFGSVEDAKKVIDSNFDKNIVKQLKARPGKAKKDWLPPGAVEHAGLVIVQDLDPNSTDLMILDPNDMDAVLSGEKEPLGSASDLEDAKRMIDQGEIKAPRAIKRKKRQIPVARRKKKPAARKKVAAGGGGDFEGPGAA